MVDFKAIQDKVQKKWADERIFKVAEDKTKKKFYCLEMFPYPSASFLHMGHVRNYSIGDAIARFKRMNGFNVLYPMGYDSFGLPAENAAKKEKRHPREYTEHAISKIMDAQKRLGFSYDWDRMIASHTPEYYKWNQYFFIKFFEQGLAYRKKASVNYCETCKTVLANEEVEQGTCWRCHNPVVQKDLDQWFLKTTAYVEELLNDIPKLAWSDKIKAIQENWIGKSHGTMINFHLDNPKKEPFPIFTTRPDTIYGVTFMVIALDHPRLHELIKGTPYEETVKKFIEESRKAEAAEDKDFLEKAGVFTGLYAINPLTKDRVPIYAGNFVVASYATGMIMAVPAHDQRDYEFAKKYNIPIKIVIQNPEHSLKLEHMKEAYVDDGILVNSGPFSGMNNREAIEKITDYAEKNNLGRKTVQYKLKDWLISRQRYWGTPIPMLYCEKDGVVPVPLDQLPLLLPDDVDFSTTGNPLLTSKSFAHAKCPKCGAPARRETDTMGGFMDSSWYFLRYCSPHRNDVPFDREAVDYWMPVDQYVGGIEHAVGHLIYSRFFTKVLRDMDMLSIDEPFNALFNQGVVYKNGKRMSKSQGNTVTQDEVENKYGIDAARLYMLFIAAPDKDIEWSDEGMEGSYKSILKLYRLYEDFSKLNSFSDAKDRHLVSKANIVIRDVTDYINDFKLNNAIISIMELVGYIYDNRENVSRGVLTKTLRDLALMLNPFTPHISEEFYEMTGGEGFASKASWPEYRKELIDESLHMLETMVDNTKRDVHAVLDLAKIAKPQSIDIIIAPAWKYELVAKVNELMQQSKNPKDVISGIMKTDLKKHGQDIMKLVPKLIEKPQDSRISQQQEFDSFLDARKALEEAFSCIINIVKAEDSGEKKAAVAMPSKPAIIAR